MLTQADLQPYREMRANGATMAEVYTAAFNAHESLMRRRDILMKVFGLNETAVIKATNEADTLAYSKYLALRNTGARVQDVMSVARADGHSQIEVLRIAVHGFGLNGVAANQIFKQLA